MIALDMDFPGYKTQYLERLSTDELIGLAEKHGLDMPVGIERIFIIEELLYLDREGIGITEPPWGNTTLPKQHNISTIEVLVRDPLWAFVFWDIKGHDQDMYESNAEFEGYCLRAIPQNDMGALFTVAVGTKNSAWYLGFPPDSENFFKVELCVPQHENYIVLAASRPFKMPRLIRPKRDEDKEIQSIYQNPLAQLSGVERFSLLRSVDRQLRSRSE